MRRVPYERSLQILSQVEQPPVVASSTRSKVIKAVSALAAVALVAVVASSGENPLLQAELPGTPASTTQMRGVNPCIGGTNGHGWDCTTASTTELKMNAAKLGEKSYYRNMNKYYATHNNDGTPKKAVATTLRGKGKRHGINPCIGGTNGDGWDC